MTEVIQTPVAAEPVVPAEIAPQIPQFRLMPLNMPGQIITKCQGMLPNRMQCTKAGQYIMTVGDQKDSQFCAQHAKMLSAGLSTAGIPAIEGTGTVQAMPIDPKEFEVKPPVEHHPVTVSAPFVNKEVLPTNVIKPSTPTTTTK